MAEPERPDPVFWKESELLAALMGAGVARELIQPLAAIANYVKAAERFLSGNPGSAAIQNARSAMAKAAEQTVRAGLMIRYLRDFVERHDGEKSPQDINQVIREALALRRRPGHGNVHIDLRLAPSLPPVAVDRIQMQQLLLYLIRSVVDEAEDAERVEIAILSARDLDHVEIQVRNNIGFSHADGPLGFAQDRRGIGLKICRTVVEAHRGTIRMLEEGRRFEIRLPLP